MTENRANTITLRPARAADSAALSNLAMASKAYWGYDDAFLEMCREELTITPSRIDREAMVVAEQDGWIVGFYAYAVRDSEIAEVMDVFVDPGLVGAGLGRQLFKHMCDSARSAGLKRLEIDADPHARAFYERMGAVHVGEAASVSIPGRMLPQLTLDL